MRLDRWWLICNAAAATVALLPHSRNVDHDLQELGLDESYRRWTGMHAYSSGAPMDDEVFVHGFNQRTGFTHVAIYYARHPQQLWRILIGSLAEAGRERPYLGNYDRRTGAAEFQQSYSFALPSCVDS